ILALDPSKGADSKIGDYSAYVLLGIDRHGVLYVEAEMARRPTPEMVETGVRLCERFNPHSFGLEANQFQDLLRGEFKQAFSRMHAKQRTVHALHNSVSKVLRMRTLGPYLSQWRMRFHSKSKSTRLLVDQLRDFPLGAHDDGPDALEMALRLAEDVWNGRHADDGVGDRLPVGP